MSTLRLCGCCARMCHHLDIGCVDRDPKQGKLEDFFINRECILPVVFAEHFVSGENNNQREKETEGNCLFKALIDAYSKSIIFEAGDRLETMLTISLIIQVYGSSSFFGEGSKLQERHVHGK